MITVIGIFTEKEPAEQVAEYLMANEFDDEHIDLHTDDASQGAADHISNFFSHVFDNSEDATHYASLSRNGTIVTVHAASTREAQEAVDAFNNHGAISVNANDSCSLLVEKIIVPELRLRGK